MLIKICGISTAPTLKVALESGADMVGFVFHPKSPRYITPENAAVLAQQARGKAQVAALFADQDLAEIRAIADMIKPDLLQLHGQETPAGVSLTAEATGVAIMKAIGVARAGDLEQVASYAGLAKYILLDAKPPKNAAYPGGHGLPFDWNILTGLGPKQPFMLSGGLTPGNVGDAIRIIRGLGVALTGVDVSSGVETAPGVKDTGKIRDFIQAVRTTR